jgi:hypothetical protein
MLKSAGEFRRSVFGPCRPGPARAAAAVVVTATGDREGGHESCADKHFEIHNPVSSSKSFAFAASNLGAEK